MVAKGTLGGAFFIFKILSVFLYTHFRIPCNIEGIDTSFSVMAVTPQTPKCHHNLGYASVVVTFGSLWCHSHDRKRRGCGDIWESVVSQP